jgi:hypothetical protein
MSARRPVKRGKPEGLKVLTTLARFCKRNRVVLSGNFSRPISLYDREGFEIATFTWVDDDGLFQDLELGLQYGGPNPLTGVPNE